jgi:hypothetical protein
MNKNQALTMCKINRGWSGYFSPLPRFNSSVYADWKLARKPRLILHVTVATHTKDVLLSWFLKSTADCPLMWVTLFELIFSIFSGFYDLRFGTTVLRWLFKDWINKLTVFRKRWITATELDCREIAFNLLIPVFRFFVPELKIGTMKSLHYDFFSGRFKKIASQIFIRTFSSRFFV